MSKINFNWLHLSDFHIGTDEYGQQQLFAEIIEHVQDQASKGIFIDYIFLTGDIAYKGVEKEYEFFNKNFLEPLQKAIGGGIEKRTFSIPGNHDVDRKKQPGFSPRKISPRERVCGRLPTWNRP